MKKTIIALIMVAFGMGSAVAQKITLLAPNGGENLVSGTPLQITWTYSKLTGNETLLIALEGAVDYGPIAYSKVSQGSIEWLAGQKMDKTFAKPASDYRIIIEIRGGDEIYDVSDATFSLAPPVSSISLMTPNGGEILEKGMDFDINWSLAGKEGFVSLSLLKDDLLIGPIAENLPAASFRYHWHIGDPLLNGMTYGAGNNFRIQVQWHLNPNPAAAANAKGILQTMAVTAPNSQLNSDRSDGMFSISSSNKDKAKKDARDTQK